MALLIGLAWVLFTGCDDSLSLFPGIEAERRYELSLSLEDRVLPEGCVIVLGSELGVRLSFTGGANVDPESISVDFIPSADGPSLKYLIKRGGAKKPLGMEDASSQDVEQAVGPTHAIVLPRGFAPGAYTILVKAQHQDGAEWQKAQACYLLPAAISLESFTSFPLTAIPGRPVLLDAELLAPEGIEPWFRFSMDGTEFAVVRGKIEAAGIASAPVAPAAPVGAVAAALPEAPRLVLYRAKALWISPEKEGLNAIKVEAFPFPPPGERYTFDSPVKSEMRLVTSFAAAGDSNELGPEASYSKLFHLRGDFLDASPSGAANPAAPFGEPGIEAHSQGFGSQLDGASGFRSPGFVLPRDKAGRAAPATLRFLLAAGPQAEGAVLLKSDDGAGLSLSLVDGGADGLVLELAVGKVRARSASGIRPADARKAVAVDVSIIPRGPFLEVMWATGGAPRKIEAIDFSFGAIGLAGRTTLGAEKGGFVGIIDEFGVFCRDAAGNPAVWDGGFAAEPAAALAAREGGLLLAQGFDGLGPRPGDLSIGGFADFSRGRLVLEPNSYANFPRFSTPQYGFSLECAIDGGAQAIVSLLVEGESEYLARVRLDGSVSIEGIARSIAPIADGKLLLKVAIGATGSTISLGGVSIPLSGRYAGRAVELRISNPTRGELGISSVLAIALPKQKEAKKLP